MNLADCLPPNLREPPPSITRMAVGMSGAGVYRVEAAGQSYALKVADPTENTADWRSALYIQRLAANANLAPRVLHADEQRRAVLSAFVDDRSFIAFYRNPRTQETALSLLGRTVRRIHALPLPEGACPRDPRQFLLVAWGDFLAGFPLPDFASDAAKRVLAEEPPPSERALVLGHNDLNPSNLVYDGEEIRVLDWATAGPTDVFYDLAVLAVFLRMDQGTCIRLLSAYDGLPCTGLPSRFLYLRRLAAALAGTVQLSLARQFQHPGATGQETRDGTLSLGEFYQRMRDGTLKLMTAEGKWAFGLALLKESLEL